MKQLFVLLLLSALSHSQVMVQRGASDYARQGLVSTSHIVTAEDGAAAPSAWAVVFAYKDPAASHTGSTSQVISSRRDNGFVWSHTNSTFQGACQERRNSTFVAAKVGTITLDANRWYVIGCRSDGTNLKCMWTE